MDDPGDNLHERIDIPSSGSTPPASLFNSAFIESIKDKTIDFFSNASNQTLGVCLVGLSAATYIVLGRVGLVLIGVVGGVALHASWENADQDGSGGPWKKLDISRRKETALEVAQRVLDWRGKQVDAAGADWEVEPLDFTTFRPATAEALSTLVDAVVRDYVKFWYSPILPTEIRFPAVCRQTLTKFILSISSHLARKRPADTFLDFVTNSSSTTIVFLNQLSQALSANPVATPTEAIRIYLQHNPDSSLANILDRKQQQKKLTLVASDILAHHLEETAFRCVPARVFLREMLASVALEQSLTRCSQSEWINDWIIYLLEDGEPEIMNVIDDSIEKAAGQSLRQKDSLIVTEDGTVIEETVEEKRADDKESIKKAAEQLWEQKDTLFVTEDGTVIEETLEERHTNVEGSVDSTALCNGNNIKSKEQPFANLLDDDTSESTHGTRTPASTREGSVVGDLSSSVVSTSGMVLEDGTLSQRSSSLEQPTGDTGDFPEVRSSDEEPRRHSELFSLHHATIALWDDSDPNDKRAIRSKPNDDYLVQVEPVSSNFRGWMVARTFEDFETLHEILRRIANVSGLKFVKTHSHLPPYRSLTKSQLRGELERYLIDAMSFEGLAESEGMKRFLDKDLGMTSKAPASSKTAFWPNAAALETMGRGVYGAMSNAQKGVARGGKVVMGGVTGVLGGSPASDSRKSMSSGSPLSRNTSFDVRSPSMSLDGEVVGNTLSRTQSIALESPRQSTSSLSSGNEPKLSGRRDSSPAVNSRKSLSKSARQSSQSRLHLPPPPSEVADDYTPSTRSTPTASRYETTQLSHLSADGTSFFDVPTPPPSSRTQSRISSTAHSQSNSPAPHVRRSIPSASTPKSSARTTDPVTPTPPNASALKPSKIHAPLTEQETQMTVELFFATITELYTLSSAWQIRLTLLTAAKSFLMRPGNPQLTSICTLIQQNVLDANTSDAGIANLMLKLRANAMPTEDELKTWPEPPSETVKDERRIRARKLLVERGMPSALTSVMGSAASGEALGKVFDCLQVEEVARGLVYGLLLQAVRVLVQ